MDSSTLKREVAEGVDIMVVRELTGGIAKLVIWLGFDFCRIGKFLWKGMVFTFH